MGCFCIMSKLKCKIIGEFLLLGKLFRKQQSQFSSRITLTDTNSFSPSSSKEKCRFIRIMRQESQRNWSLRNCGQIGMRHCNIEHGVFSTFPAIFPHRGEDFSILLWDIIFYHLNSFKYCIPVKNMFSYLFKIYG